MSEQFKTPRTLFKGQSSNGFEYRVTVEGNVVQIWSTESGCVWRVRRAMHRADFEKWAVKERLVEDTHAVGDKLKALAEAVGVKVNNS